MGIRYLEAFIEQALFKVYSRGKRSVKSVAEELNVNCHTVKNWVKRKEVDSGVSPVKEKRPQDWTPEQQLIALHQTHGLSGEALQIWCRENGLFPHHLSSWKVAFCADSKVAPNSCEIRVLKDENDQLKQELVRKERATADAGGQCFISLSRKICAEWVLETIMTDWASRYQLFVNGRLGEG